MRVTIFEVVASEEQNLTISDLRESVPGGQHSPGWMQSSQCRQGGAPAVEEVGTWAHAGACGEKWGRAGALGAVVSPGAWLACQAM